MIYKVSGLLLHWFLAVDQAFGGVEQVDGAVAICDQYAVKTKSL